MQASKKRALVYEVHCTHVRTYVRTYAYMRIYYEYTCAYTFIIGSNMLHVQTQDQALHVGSTHGARIHVCVCIIQCT